MARYAPKEAQKHPMRNDCTPTFNNPEIPHNSEINAHQAYASERLVVLLAPRAHLTQRAHIQTRRSLREALDPPLTYSPKVLAVAGSPGGSRGGGDRPHSTGGDAGGGAPRARPPHASDQAARRSRLRGQLPRKPAVGAQQRRNRPSRRAADTVRLLLHYGGRMACGLDRSRGEVGFLLLNTGQVGGLGSFTLHSTALLTTLVPPPPTESGRTGFDPKFPKFTSTAPVAMLETRTQP